nr:HD domain-containing protein [Desulfobacterales bacterium]
MADFIAALVSVSGKPISSAHLQVGIVEVKFSTGSTDDIPAEIEEDIEKVKEINQELSKFGKLDMVGLEDVVMSFMSTLQREANVLNIVSPVKAHSEYTFAHTSNVTILSIFMAECLGLQGDILHEVGLAGLLHDVGKSFIPLEILEKEGKLTDEEWNIMRNHTVYGSMY